MKLSKIKENPDNPRYINEINFTRLQANIKDFTKMFTVRPIVIDENNVILGGNMRYKALLGLGYTEVDKDWIKKVTDWTPKEKENFIISDNVAFGQWDYDMLANDYNEEDLYDYGLDTPDTWTEPEEEEPDYDILNDPDLKEQAENMKDGTRKALLIEFEMEHYKEAYDLVKFWRDQEAYVGQMLIEKLKDEKQKLEG
jgi:hypothetical protein